MPSNRMNGSALIGYVQSQPAKQSNGTNKLYIIMFIFNEPITMFLNLGKSACFIDANKSVAVSNFGK